jgi:hypothetical protein
MDDKLRDGGGGGADGGKLAGCCALLDRKLSCVRRFGQSKNSDALLLNKVKNCR